MHTLIVTTVLLALTLARSPARPVEPEAREQLSHASRIFVERAAPYYSLASDGSLWTHEVAAMREDEHDEDRVRAFVRADAPLWYSPDLSERHGFPVTARSRENILVVLSELDLREQLAVMKQQAVESGDLVLIQGFKGEGALRGGLVGRFVPVDASIATRDILLTQIPPELEIERNSITSHYMLIKRSGTAVDTRSGKRNRTLDNFVVVGEATRRSPLEYGVRPVEDADELARLVHERDLEGLPDWKLHRVKVKDGVNEHMKIEVVGKGVLRRRKVTKTGGAEPVFEWQWKLSHKRIRWERADD